ncbi:MAG TPA: (Fe-S)-binding protein [Chitinophagaceae bacterium]|nr:(Fe-S)-binding protein [Chitinophagaceae bacterium]
MNIQLFIPCFIDQLFPQTAFNMIKVLKKVGCTVQYNEKQTCCGQPAFNAGYWKDATKVCEKFLQDFEGSDYIVAPSASCVGFVKNYYKKLAPSQPSPKGKENLFLEGIQNISGRIYEFSEFLTKVLNVTDVGATLNAKATYHDSCAALRECNIKEAPRTLLQHVKGLALIEMEETTVCCGFGGTFAVKFEPISIAMADQKINHALATGADYIISTDMSCLMHLDGYIKHKGYALKTLHIADVLARQ